MKKILMKVLLVLSMVVSLIPMSLAYGLESKTTILDISNIVKEALINGESKADLSALNIHKSTYLLEDGVNAFLFSIPYLSNGIEGSLYANNAGYLTYIKIDTDKNGNEIKQHINRIEAKLSEIKSYMNTNYSDEKNALILHDYMVREYSYDKEAESLGVKNAKEAFKIGGLLLNQKGVCMSYALLYKYILESYGIETYYIKSDSMNHAWNIVNIDGSYYHVDVTYDDPSPDQFGIVLHNNFLLSDLKIKDTNHYNWDNKGMLCNNFKYDKYYWRNVYSPIIVDQSGYYYVNNHKFVYKDNNANATIIDDNLNKWSTGYGTHWVESYSGVFKNGQYIYYNGPDVIKRYNLNTKTIENVYTIDGNGDIYGCRQIGVNLYFNKTNTPKEVNVVKVNGITLNSLVPSVSKIQTNVTDIVMNIGDKKIFYVSLYPAHASTKYNMKISDNTIATSDKDGNIIAKKAGKTTITITSDNGVKKVVNIRVRKALPFKDVPKSAWYRETIEEVYDLGLMTGATATLFKPDSKMNRGMVATVFYRMEGSPKTSYVKKFSDVASGQYYSVPVTWAANKKIITGYNNGTFRPIKDITREEMVTMVARFANYKGKYAKKTYNLNKFTDGSQVSTYAKEYMQWAIASGVMSGKYNGTKLDPLGTATRAECSKMLLKGYELIYK